MRLRVTDPVEIRRLIAEHGRWWHEMELGPGIITPGDDSNRMKLPLLESLGFPRDMNGKRALDTGCSDGFFSFEMERRGAQVIAIDFVPETYSGFATARKILDSKVEYRMENVYNVSTETLGHFDVVLFLGVLYHLRKPLATVISRTALRRTVARSSCSRGSAVSRRRNTDRLDGRLRASDGDRRSTYCEVYQTLDARLEKTAFDPAMPYFLDEEGAVHTVTGQRAVRRPWWKFWK